MLSTIMWTIVAVAIFVIWVICRIAKASFQAIKRNIDESREQKEQALRHERLTIDESREQKERALRHERLTNYYNSIDHTDIIAKRRVDDSSRKHHHETTFMVYMRDGSRTATTVVDGSLQYDQYISKVQVDGRTSSRNKTLHVDS